MGTPSLAVALVFVAGALLPQAAPPKPDHVVIVIEENHAYSQIIGSGSAPYINSLATQGALFTQSFAVTHPSQPNYLHLFSGSAQGTTDDTCPAPGSPYSAENLGGELIAKGLTFEGYSEGLPSTGSTSCSSGSYMRKHNPWTDFTDVPSTDNLPWTSFPGSSAFSTLPTVSFVVPNQLDDMHDGTIAQADTWLKNNIDAYVQWAKTHNSLLIVTFDEDDGSEGNRIATIFVGPMVKAGTYSEHITHHTVLRTVEDMYGLGHAGNASSVSPITDCWTSAGGAPPPGGGGSPPPSGSSGGGGGGGGGGGCGLLGLDALLAFAALRSARRRSP